jgi:uncharacterized protein (TIGR02996 family)
MNEREALLAAIRENWRENTPRLVFADWLEEHGSDEWDKATCELIRLSQRRTKSEVIRWLEHKYRWQIFVPTLLKATPRLRYCRAVARMHGEPRMDLAFQYVAKGMDDWRSGWIGLVWEKGFVRSYRSATPFLKRMAEPILALDCPLVQIQQKRPGIPFR